MPNDGETSKENLGLKLAETEIQTTGTPKVGEHYNIINKYNHNLMFRMNGATLYMANTS